LLSSVDVPCAGFMSGCGLDLEGEGKDTEHEITLLLGHLPASNHPTPPSPPTNPTPHPTPSPPQPPHPLPPSSPPSSTPPTSHRRFRNDLNFFSSLSVLVRQRFTGLPPSFFCFNFFVACSYDDCFYPTPHHLGEVLAAARHRCPVTFRRFGPMR